MNHTIVIFRLYSLEEGVLKNELNIFGEIGSGEFFEVVGTDDNYYEHGGDDPAIIPNEKCKSANDFFEQKTAAYGFSVNWLVDEDDPSGTYNFAQFDQNNTTDFKVDSDGLYMWDERFGGIGEYDIVSGTVKVEEDGDDHIISIEFITTDGKIFRGSYEGYMPEENAIVISSIREDVNFGTISGDGELAFCGDENYDGATYYWVATMCGGGVYIEDGSVKGTGVCLTLEGFSDQSRRDAMPAGTYFLDQKIASAGDIVPFMLWAGRLSRGNPWYCWYLEYENGEIVDYSALAKGGITVSHNGDKHRIEWDTFDDAGNKITGVYEAVFDYQNWAREAPQQSAALKSRARGLDTSFGRQSYSYSSSALGRDVVVMSPMARVVSK